MKSFYTCFNAPWGKIFVSKTPKGINALAFSLEELKRLNSRMELTKNDKVFSALKEKFKKYFSGGKTVFNEKLDLKGTAFQKRVWGILKKIPQGETKSYKWVAQKIGAAQKARAVGNACGSNPIGIIIPCHRIVKSDGGLGGYAGGLSKKKFLLDLERRGNKIK
jgi:methylated-DNA-[protein]-cysteine S-methyltransferase